MSFDNACWWKNREYTPLHAVTSGLLAFITLLAFMMCAVKKKSLVNESLAFTARVIKCGEAVQAPLLHIKGVAYVVSQLGSRKGLPSHRETSLHNNFYDSLGKSPWRAKEDAVDLLSLEALLLNAINLKEM